MPDNRLSILFDPPGAKERIGYAPGHPVRIDSKLEKSNHWMREPYDWILVDPFKEPEHGRSFVCVEVSGRVGLYFKIMRAEDVRETRRTSLIGPCSITWPL